MTRKVTIPPLSEHSPLTKMTGPNGNTGYLPSTRGKALLYDAAADAFRNKETVLHSFATFTQPASIEGTMLRVSEVPHGGTHNFLPKKWGWESQAGGGPKNRFSDTTKNFHPIYPLSWAGLNSFGQWNSVVLEAHSHQRTSRTKPGSSVIQLDSRELNCWTEHHGSS